ncbi:tetraspanin-8 [Dromiciops gliroides]|uniref:tetraspanin-8 n=1 Tax=Dromiciops gliroides TaxID=33562 RepID=UPI001CC42B16|nr:tetraspanin-8 [Dromiciops gliroides]
MGAVSGFVKYSMFIFNFIFWVCGCVILGVSIYARVSKYGQELISENANGINVYPAMNLLIAVGTIIMILGFLGCCGAMKESRCMLLLFFIGLLLILLLQIAAGVVGFVFRSKVEKTLKSVFESEVKILNESNPESENFRKNLDKMQQKFKCCGLIHGAADWGNNFDKYSASCECTNEGKSICVQYKGKTVYKESCGERIISYLKKHLVIIGGIAFGVAVVEILGLVFSMVLYRQIGGK